MRLPLGAVGLHEDFGGAQVTANVPLGSMTTLRVGPTVRRVITCTTADQIVKTLGTLDDTGEPALVLGGGSNVVVADELTDLTVVRLATTAITLEGATLRAEAGADWDSVVAHAVRAGLGGLECLSGIPGSAGPPRCRTSEPTASRSPTG